jgi:hypothetical protein
MKIKITDAERRKFLKQSSLVGFGLYLGTTQILASGKSGTIPAENEPLLDWTLWEQFRTSVKHPCLTIKPQNLDFALENIKRYPWAGDYASRVERKR